MSDAATEDRPGAAAAGTRSRTLTVLALFVAMFAVMLNISIVNVALPAIGTDFDVGLSGLQWVVNAFAVLFAMLLLPGGMIGDRLGLRAAFLSSLGVFIAGSVTCTVAPTFGVLIAGRMMQGAAGALLLPTNLALVAHLYPDPARRARFIGLWSALNGIAISIGPVLGGWLTEAFDWRAVFAVSVPVAVAALGISVTTLRVPAAAGQGRVDVAGLVLSLIWVGALTYGLTEGPNLGWTSPLTVGLFVVAAVAFAAFVRVEQNGPGRMLPMSQFRDGTFSGANIASFVIGFSLFSAFVFLSLYMQQVLHYSALRTGFALLSAAGVMALSAPVAGMLVARRGPRLPVTVGLVASGLGLLAMATLSADGGYAPLSGMLAVFGFGVGLSITPTNAAVLAAAPADRTATASATVNMARQLGLALGVAVLGVLLSVGMGDAPHSIDALVRGFRYTFAAGGVVTLVGAVVTAACIRAARR